MSHPIEPGDGQLMWKAVSDGLEPLGVRLEFKQIATAGGYQDVLNDTQGHRYQPHVHFGAYEEALAQMVKDAQTQVRANGGTLARLKTHVRSTEVALGESVMRMLKLEESQRDEEDVAAAKVAVK